MLDVRCSLVSSLIKLAAFQASGDAHMKVIRENSRFRFGWDLFILVLIIASCLLIPFQIAFRHVTDWSGTEIVYLIDLFFLIDIVLNFFTSYRHKGTEIADRKKVSAHYLKTLFVIDLLANFPLDAFFLMFQDIQVYSVSLVLILRIPRFLRVVRMFVIFRRWEDQSWTNSGYLRIAKFFTAVMLFTHWIACAWYLVAYISNFPPDCWVVIMGMQDAAVATRYIRSLYWTIVTMTTVGYGDIAPQTVLGKLLASAVMILGYGIIAVPTGIVSVEIATAHRRGVSTQACLECAAEGHDQDAIHCKFCGAKL